MGWKVKRVNNNQIVCSLCKAPTVYLEPIPRQKIEILLEEYPYQEWLGYLIGKILAQMSIFVEELSIPPHKEAYSASAEAEPFHIPDKCVGVIHSHHSMGAFHSETDQAYVDKNFPVSITVAMSITVANRKGQGLEFDAISYQVTPCGKRTVMKSAVKYVQSPPLFDKSLFLKEAKENIDKGRRTYTYQQPKLIDIPYVPIRYRVPTLGDYVIDEHGHVLTDKELEDILWED